MPRQGRWPSCHGLTESAFVAFVAADAQFGLVTYGVYFISQNYQRYETAVLVVRTMTDVRTYVRARRARTHRD